MSCRGSRSLSQPSRAVRRWSSTRSTPGSGASPRMQLRRRCSGWASARRCSRSRTCRRSRASPSATSGSRRSRATRRTRGSRSSTTPSAATSSSAWWAARSSSPRSRSRRAGRVAPAELPGTVSSRGQVRVRHGRRRLGAREGDRRRVARPSPQGTRPRSPGAEVRPVPERRPGHDEPVPARRGVRHRGRRRDRPRHRTLRAVHRREPLPQREPHGRCRLGHRSPSRAQGRVPRCDRPGHPAHHERDQVADQAGGEGVARRRRHLRDRRHGR